MDPIFDQDVLGYCKVEESASPPCIALGSDAYDLASAMKVTIPPHSRKVVSTSLILQINSKYTGRISPRSGLSSKGIDIGAGVLDANYRGVVGVCVINQSDELLRSKLVLGKPNYYSS